MGASGAAFTTTIDPASWDPLAAAPLDDRTLERGARAAGVRPDRVIPPFDEEMRALIVDRLLEALDAKLPPLVRGAVGPPEFGLVVGYELARPRADHETEGKGPRGRAGQRNPDDERGTVSEPSPTFLVRTYFDRSDEPSQVGWDAFARPGRGELVFLDRAAAPDRAVLARDAIDGAVADAEASDAAMRAWLDALRDEARWGDLKHGGSAAFADHAMRTILADKRRAAARFLRSARDAVTARAGAETLRAAEAYGKVAEAAELAGVGPFDPGVAARFVEGGHRRAWAKGLEGALRHEAEAHDALRAARSAM